MHSYIGLSSRTCKPAAELVKIEGKEQDLMKNQVPGWKVNPSAIGDSMKQEWKLKDAESAAKMAGLVNSMSSAEGHPVKVTQEAENVSVEMHTASVGKQGAMGACG